MLKKEIFDSLKTLIQCLLLLIGVPLGFVMDKLIIHFGWKLSEIFNFLFLISIVIYPIASGLYVFQSEKKDRAFEYLLSLPLSRLKIIIYKVLPRLSLLLLLITVSTFFSIFNNIWINGFNLIVLFFVSLFIAFATTSVVLGPVIVTLLFYAYYVTSQMIHMIFIGLKPEIFNAFSTTAFFFNLLTAVLLLVPIGSAFWITFKKFDIKPLKWQLKSYYFIVLPTILVFMSFIILFYKKYLSTLQG
jgi:hypothetical protein